MGTLANPWKIGGACGIAFLICFIVGLVFLVELEGLKGRARFDGCDVHAVVTYP